jgi:hypothetical protein
LAVMPEGVNVVIEFPIIPGYEVLRRAVAHVRNQLCYDMSREDKLANIDARIILINLNTKLLDEAKAECDRG